MSESRFDKLLYAVVGLALVGGFFLLLNGIQVAHWQGRARLHFVVSVSDADTRDPIEGAVVEIRHLDRGPNPELGVHVTTLKSDAAGNADTVADISHGGRSSQFGFGDRQAASIPDWRIEISSPKYQSVTIEWIGKHQTEVKQIGGAEYELKLKANLKKLSP